MISIKYKINALFLEQEKQPAQWFAETRQEERTQKSQNLNEHHSVNPQKQAMSNERIPDWAINHPRTGGRNSDADTGTEDVRKFSLPLLEDIKELPEFSEGQVYCIGNPGSDRDG